MTKGVEVASVEKKEEVMAGKRKPNILILWGDRQ
jgi:hypothetical protein